MSATRAGAHKPVARGEGAERRARAPTRIAKLGNRGTHIAITWGDGHVSRFDAAWLRDNCRCAECRDPHNGQRLFDIAALPGQPGVSRLATTASGDLSITFAPETHRGRIPSDWLRAHCYEEKSRRARRPRPRLWDRKLTGALPEADHAAVTASRTALGRWLGLVQSHGFALLRGVPLDDGQVIRVAALFGFVRETNYGRLFDVSARPAPNNLAYTGLGLGVHTDNPYRDPVPGLQLLHCLEASAEGGESVLVDGFRVAETLREDAPEHFALLSGHEVPFRFSDAGSDLRARGPLIQLDRDGAVRAIRYNSRSADALDLPADIMTAFYEAYRHFGRLMGRPEGEVVIRLAPGDLLMLDNRRVLHGRRPFAAGDHRRLQGCYADCDALDSLSRKIAAER